MDNKEVFVGLTYTDINVIINGLTLALRDKELTKEVRNYYMDVRDKIILVKEEIEDR